MDRQTDEEELKELLDNLLKADYRLSQSMRCTHRHKLPEIERMVERIFRVSLELAKNFPNIFNKYKVLNIIVDIGKDRK